MAEKKKLTVAEMLAAARKADSKGGAAEPAEAAAPVESPAEASAPAESAAPATPPKDPKKMSVAEMMAAARAEKAAGAKPAAAESAPAAAAATPAAPAKDAKKMSVAEMMAAARAEKAAGAKPAAAAKSEAGPAAADKSSPKPAAAAKPVAKETAPVATEKDTASILAAIRKTAKPGPVSKAEAPVEKKPAGKVRLEAPPMPEKPAYARPKVAAAAPATDRRGFMGAMVGVFFGSSVAIGFTSLAVTNLLWVLGLARFMFPNILIEPPTKFKVGSPDDFSPGQVSEKYKAQFGVWIVRYEWEGQPEIYALKTVCTHLGCTPNWLEGEQKFKCPCHGSGFYKDGVNFEGPAPRPLERYAISKADDGQLLVDKSATFHEETGQWSDPACFVPV